MTRRQSADERAGGDRAAHLAGEVATLVQSADERAGRDLAAHVAGGVVPQQQSADERASCDTQVQSGGLQSVTGLRRDV